MNSGMRPQRPCRQPHGTVACYQAGCSCLRCCNAWADYQRLRKADMWAGMTRTVDAGEARAHIMRLARSGWGARAIAEQSLVSRTTISDIRAGRRLRIRREIADAILTLRPGRPLATSSTALVPAKPTQQLLERLCLEHGKCAVARAAGLSSHNSLPRSHQRSVQARTAKRIAVAALQLGGRRP